MAYYHLCKHLPEYDYSVATPVRKKDNTLGKILIAILVIPIALILLLIVFAIPLSYSNVSGGGSFSTSSVTTLTVSEFLVDCNEKEAILYQDYFNEFSSDTEQPCHLLVYDANHTDGIINHKKYLMFDLFCTPAETEQTVTIFHYEGSKELPYEYLIRYNGVEYELPPVGHVDTPFLPEES